MTKVDVFDTTTGHVAVAGLPSEHIDLVQDGFGTMPHEQSRRCRGCGCASNHYILCESCSGDWQQHGFSSPHEKWSDEE
jgi:hypothetical protein